MKSKSPWIVLVMVVVITGLVDAVMWHSEALKIAALEADLTAARAENARLQADAGSAAEKLQALEAESAQLRAARALESPRLEPDAAATPAEEEKPKSKGSLLAQMFKDPQMRKLLAAQQAGALRGLYADFLKDAHLTPDQTDKFFQLLQDRQMALMDSSATAMSGGQVDPNAATAATNAANDALKDLLGPDQYSAYQSFEKTLGSRIQVQQLGQQLAGAGMPLQDYQNTALVQIMSEETAAMPAFNNGQQGMANMTQAQIDQYSQNIDAANQQIYNRAMSILSPAQLTVFGNYQKTMATAQIAGMKMAQQMMNPSQ